MHDNQWIQFIWEGNRFKVKVLFANVVAFQNCDNVGIGRYYSARKWFIKNQEQFNLQGLIDPFSDAYDMAGHVLKTRNKMKKIQEGPGAKKGT